MNSLPPKKTREQLSDEALLAKRLMERLQYQVEAAAARRRRRGRTPASSWDGKSYGTGAAKAAPCVEFTTCEVCHQKPGRLCVGVYGPHWGTHHDRRRAYRALVRAAKEKLAAS